MKIRLKLQGKMLFAILLAITVVFGIIGVSVTGQVSSIAGSAARESLAGNAAATGSLIESMMNTSVGNLRAYASMASELNSDPESARDELLAVTSRLVADNPDLTSAWFVFEPDAFDGRDARYAGRNGFNEAGRMMAIFSRAGGQIVRTAEGIDEKSLEKAGWYRDVLSAGKETLIEPFLYNYTGKSGDETLVTTIGTPVRRGGKVVGVVGVDVALNRIDEVVSAYKLPEGGRATLFSNDGVIISRFDKKSIGTNYRALNAANQEEVLRNMHAGLPMTFSIPAPDGRGTTAFYHQPVKIGDAGKPWSYSLSVPSAVTERQISAATQRVVLFCLGGLALLAVIITVLVRRVVRPIVTMSRTLSRYGELDLRESGETGLPDMSVLERSHDEIGEMSRALRSLRESISVMVTTLNAEGDSFAGTSQQLSALSQELVASVDTVRHNIDTVVALADRNSEVASGMAQTAGSTADSAANSAQMAQQAAENAARTNALSEGAVSDVAQVMEEMERLSGETKVCDENIGKLSRAVESITEFVSSISSIADQTNLLALNAAIEAARAGEAGKGFAVVAEEVRKLAENSNSAAKKVSELVSSLSTEAESASGVFSNVLGGLQGIDGKARNAMDNLRQVQSEIGQLSENIQGIAAVAQEQAAASSEMMSSLGTASAAMGDIKSAVDKIMTSADETLGASEHVSNGAQALASGSEKLKELLEQFKISGQKESLPIAASPSDLRRHLGSDRANAA